MANYVTLAGSQRGVLPHSRSAGPVDPAQIVTLTIRVRARQDIAALHQRVLAQAAQPICDRTYLTRAELASQFGADPADLDQVETFVQQHNLMVVHRSAAERSLKVRGKIGDVLAAFPAQVRLYHHPNGAYRGRSGQIKIPDTLAPIITGIFGFDTRRKHRSRRAVQLHSDDLTQPRDGVVATAYAQRYNFPTHSGQTALDGAGQTIAIIELGGGFRSSDLQLFFNQAGIALPNVASISVDSAANDPTTPYSSDGEVMLDIEVAGAVAPQAKLAVYFAPNQGSGFLDALSAAVHDAERNPGVISISWGGPEQEIDDQSLAAYHEIFLAAASLGITLCAAAGDHGVADMTAANWDKSINVDHPAADPYVLACGGTQIDSTGVDVAWNDGTPFNAELADNDGGGWAGGGGISQKFPVPDYQSALTLPPALAGGQPGRGVPDLAMCAVNYKTRLDSGDYVSRGTSAVAPLMAALVALLNQAKGKNVGFLNPLLYKNAAAVTYDVTSGSNSIADTVTGYNATPGWDACTGLGTPDGAALLAIL